MLEICIRDLIKYIPNLLNNTPSPTSTTTSFIQMHITPCKTLTSKDVQLLASLTVVLNQIPFQADLKLEKKISLISIVYHILFKLLQSVEALLPKHHTYKEIHKSFYSLIFNSFKIICSTSSADSVHFILKNQPNDR